MVVLSPRGREREGGGPLVFVLSGTVAVCVCVCVWIYGGSSLGSVAPEVCLLLTACQCVELKKCCGLALILGEAACSGCRPSENEGVILYIYILQSFSC